MTDPQYIGTDDRGMPVYHGGSRVLSAFERMFNRLSESSQATVSRRTGLDVGGALDRTGAGIAAAFAPNPAGDGFRAGARVAGSAVMDVFGAGQAVGADALYAESHPYIGGYKGPSPVYPTNPRQADAGSHFTGYRANDQITILRRMNAESLRRLQDKLVRTGFADPDRIVPDQLNDELIGAFETVLTIANREGRGWELVLADTERAIADGLYDPKNGRGGSGDGPAPFVAPAYLAPDYATLAQTVKSQLRNELGRDPDESEMALLTAELQGWDREAFDAEVSAQRAEYDAQVAAGEGAEGQSGGTVQTVDPLARFKESFESKFRGELRGIERTEEAAETSENVRGAVSTLSRMSGGMG